MSQAFDGDRSGHPERHAGVGAAQRALNIVTSARLRGGSAAARLADQFTADLDIDDRRSIRPEEPTLSSAFRLRALRRDAELALEGVFDMLRDAMDVAEGHLRQPHPGAGSIESVEVSAWPGATANATIWIHNLTARPWRTLVPRVSGLTDLDGERFAGRVSFDPALFPLLEPRASISSVLSVTPAEDARQGDYHGLLLLVGASELQPLHVRLSVRA